MNYEKKYKEALERARKIHSETEFDYEKGMMEEVFPELKENEDEKWIPKEIAKYLKEKGDFRSCWIAWLEKQGKQDNHVKEIDNSFPPKEIAKSIGKSLTLSIINYLDNNRCEGAMNMSSVNKEEQKDFFTFHEGDWIVANDWVNTNTGTNTFLIKNITCGYGSLEDTEGVVHYPCLLSENFFHPWTIRDAKDGDVLTYGLDDGKVLIMIYESLGKSFDGEVAAHALLDGDRYFSASVGSVCCKFMELLTPATKEQRDLLFQKMKEAGYKWDAENKKLRGRESADNVKPKFEISDLIKRKGKNVTFRVDRIQGGYYYCDQQYGSFFPIEEQDEWELIERKKINLINILKYYPKETRLFSPLCGYIWLAEVDEENGIITCYKNPLECGCTRATLGLEETISFYSDGTTGLPDYSLTNDCMLFLDMNRTPIDRMGPKFNIGDWIVEKDLDEFGRGIIVAIHDGKYVLNTGRSVPIKEQDEWELVKKDF